MQKRVLIIDDESDIREVASASLELVGGFEVVSAESGPEGISIAERQQPNLVVLDLMMPGMDGCQTLEQLKHNAGTQNIPVILLTAKAHAMSDESVRRAGAVGVLIKPFDPMLLPKQICELMGWPTEHSDEASA